MSLQAQGTPAAADRSLDLRRWRRWAQVVSLLMVLSGLLVAAVAITIDRSKIPIVK